MNETVIRAADLKSVCIRPECEGDEFVDLKDKEGKISPARKCVKCGLISTMFKTKV